MRVTEVCPRQNTSSPLRPVPVRQQARPSEVKAEEPSRVVYLDFEGFQGAQPSVVGVEAHGLSYGTGWGDTR